MSNLYTVKATIRDNSEPSGYRTIWHFCAIVGQNRSEAINSCKWLMKKIMGTIPQYRWIAEPEWEDNLAVN